MPHSLDERAPSLAARRILQSAEVLEFLKAGVMQGDGEKADPLIATPCTNSGQLPAFVLAIDGSLQPVPVKHGFPGAEVAYFSFASVLLNMGLVRSLEAQRPIPPSAFREVRSTTPHVMVLPGRNYRHSQDASPRACFRRLTFERLSGVGMQEGAETLLETFEALLRHRSTHDEGPKCPHPSCSAPNGSALPRSGTATCPYCNQPLYSTDWLRIHEGFNDIGENGAAYAEFMQVAERLWLINVLRTLKKTNLLQTAGSIALVLDGPLAVFGHPAWLKDAIKSELREINKSVQELTGRDILNRPGFAGGSNS